MSEPASPPPAEPSSAVPHDTVVRKPGMEPRTSSGGGILALRRPISLFTAAVCAALCLVAIFGLWYTLTRGEGEERTLQYTTIPSPAETFAAEQLDYLFARSDPDGWWFDNLLLRNLWASLKRVVLGFTLAAAVGIPLGVLCGCFPWFNALFAPVNLFGRNIPIAALIPLTFALFGIGELQKVMFIFIAAVAFVMMDSAGAVADVSSRYIDTAYTLGASRWQIIRKVLVPLAMPRIFNSLRLLFGLAFGYIMLAELVTFGDAAGGLGNIINIAQRRSRRETILLILFIIPLVALLIDRLLYLIQRSFFPHQYGTRGWLHHAWRGLMHLMEDITQPIFGGKPLDAAQRAALPKGKP